VAAPRSAARAAEHDQRPDRRRADLGYSLYLWHWPVHVYAIHRRAGLPYLIAVEIAATFALSYLSFVLVERPARRVRRPGPLVVPLAACACLILASALYLQPKPPVQEQSDVIVHGPAH
jgi:peptidoglycan/LPS O-acetylase OafA/YrhL